MYLPIAAIVQQARANEFYEDVSAISEKLRDDYVRAGVATPETELYWWYVNGDRSTKLSAGAALVRSRIQKTYSKEGTDRMGFMMMSGFTAESFAARVEELSTTDPRIEFVLAIPKLHPEVLALVKSAKASTSKASAASTNAAGTKENTPSEKSAAVGKTTNGASSALAAKNEPVQSEDEESDESNDETGDDDFLHVEEGGAYFRY